MTDYKVISMIIVIAIVTFSLRAIPFVIFKNNNSPEYINYLGKYLPFSIMAMLVVYCLKDIDILHKPFGIKEIIASLVVIILHKYKRNTLLSIVVSTIVYMLLVNLF